MMRLPDPVLRRPVRPHQLALRPMTKALPPSPTSGRYPQPRVMDMPSPSSGLRGLENDLISCSAALQMAPGSRTQTEDRDALMHHNGGAIIAGKGPDDHPLPSEG